MRYGFLILVILFLRANVDTNAQKTPSRKLTEYSFRNIDYTNGLLGNNVTSITQDSRGFIWIGSVKGLQRFDGSRFATYSNSPIAGLYPDDTGNSIWFETPDMEITQLGLLSNKLTRLSRQDAFNQGAETYSDWNGKGWVVSNSYTYKADRSGKVLSGYTLVKTPDSKESYQASILKDKNRNETWINNTKYGLVLLEDKTRKVYSTGHNSVHHPFLSQLEGKTIIPRGIMMDSRGNIWLYTWGWMFYRYNIATGSLSAYSTADIIASQNIKSNQ